MSGRAAVHAVCLVTLLLPVPAGAQTAGPSSPVADVPRDRPRAPLPAPVLLTPPPRIGHYWTGGNPSGLPIDVVGQWASYGIAVGDEDGSYKRPLDPRSLNAVTAWADADGRVSDRTAVAGSATLIVQNDDPGGRTEQIAPYGGSPLVQSDTSTPATRRVHARLDGAIGWQWDAWAAGVAVSYDAIDDRTVLTRLPRFGRVAAPAASVGVLRRLPFAGLSAAARVRYAYSVETIRILSRGAAGIVHELQGLGEPLTKDVASNSPYFRQMERDGWGMGGSLAGSLGAATWIATIERVTRDERQTGEQRAGAPEDRWSANGWSYEVAAQSPMPAGFGTVTAALAWSRMDGDGEIAGLPGVFYRAHETTLLVRAEWRMTTADSAWRVTVLAATQGQDREQNDYVAQIGADVAWWRPAIAVEVVRRLRPGTDLSAAVGLAGHYASSRIPNPAQRGPLYQELIAPELALDATQAAARSVRFVLRQRVSASAALWLGLRYDSRGPSGDPTPLGPTAGDRLTTYVGSAGVVVGL